MPRERAPHESRTGASGRAPGSDQAEISSLKLAEQSLTQEKEFSRSLLESMSDAVVACDADGVLTLFNRSARVWHGLDPLRLPPEEWARHYDLFRPDGITPLPTDEIPLARAFRGEIVTDAEMAIKAKGQPIRFILANGNVIQNEVGQKLGAVVIMRDVTEFRHLERELRKANEQLEQRVDERTEELRQINGQLQIELNERRRIENALLLTQFSVDHAADGIMWIRPDGSYCYANEAASRLLGYSAGELLTMKTSAVNPAHPVEAWPQHWEELKRSKTLFFEAALIRKDGSPVPVEIHANHVEFGDQEYNCASVRDITGRRRMEDALFFVAQRGWLADTEKFFDALAQYLGEKLDVDYVVIDRIDENPDNAQTVALYAKGAILPNMRYALKGTPCENVLGRQLCVYPQGVQQLFPEDALLVKMGVESYIGIPLWDFSGEPIGLIALMDSKPLPDTATASQLLQLVATRAAAEMARERSDRALRKTARDLNEAQRIAHVGSWELNLLTDQLSWSDEIYRIFEIDPQAFGASYEAFLKAIHPDDREAVNAAYTNSLRNRTPYAIDHRLLLSGGRIKHVHEHCETFYENDKPIRSVGTVQDVTGQKRAEEELRTLNERLEQRIVERTAELEAKNTELQKLNKIFVGRELRMVELKEKIRELESTAREKKGS